MCIAMKMAVGFSALGLLAACVETATAPGQPVVGSATDLAPFQGARAGQAEMGIRNLGYDLAWQRGLTSYYYNAQTGACAEVVTSNGRYASVRMMASSVCTNGRSA